MQNTELHNALLAPYLPSSLPAKYIKGGVLDPQCLRADSSFLIFSVMWMIIHLSLQWYLYVRVWFFFFFFFWVLSLFNTPCSERKVLFSAFTCWQIKMYSFSLSFKKCVGTGKMPPAVTFLHTLNSSPSCLPYHQAQKLQPHLWALS